MKVALDVLGHPVEVDCDDPETERVVRSMFADLLASGLTPASERITLHGPPSADVETDLAAAIDAAAVRLGTGHLMPRAAALARPDGSVVLLGGEPTSSASTTLVAALRRRGYLSVSDATTVLDPDTLEVLPVRRPAGVPTEPLEPRLLVFPEHTAEGTGTHVDVVAGGEAAYLVGSRSARLGDVTGGPLPVLARLARRVPAYRLRFDDVDAAAEEVLRLWPTD